MMTIAMTVTATLANMKAMMISDDDDVDDKDGDDVV